MKQASVTIFDQAPSFMHSNTRNGKLIFRQKLRDKMIVRECEWVVEDKMMQIRDHCRNIIGKRFQRRDRSRLQELGRIRMPEESYVSPHK